MLFLVWVEPAVVEYKSNFDFNTVTMLFGKRELFLGKQGKNNGEIESSKYGPGKSFLMMKIVYVEYPPQIKYFLPISYNGKAVFTAFLSMFLK